MRKLYREAQQERLLAILEDFGRYDASLHLVLRIAGVDYSDELESGEVGSAADHPAISLSATLAARPSQDLMNAPIYLAADIDGIIVPLLYATRSMPEPTTDNTYATDLLAASPGALLDKVAVKPNNTLKNVTEYIGWTPERVIQDALFRCGGVGGYDRGRIRIAQFGSPLIYRVAKDKDNSQSAQEIPAAFEIGTRCKAILDSIKPEVNCLYRDTPDAGHECVPDPGIGQGVESVRNYEVMGGEVLHWNPPVPAAPDEQPSEVIVYARGEDGQYVIGPITEPVYWGNIPYPPHADQTIYINMSDQSLMNVTNARQLAVDTARAYGRGGVYKAEVEVSFNPLLQKGDVLTFYEDYRDDTGLYRRAWRSVIEAYKHPFGEGISTVLSCRMYLASKQRLRDPLAPLEGYSAAVGSTGVLGTPVGVDAIGLWVNPARMLQPHWADADSSGLWIDPSLAGGFAGEDVHGLWIRYTSLLTQGVDLSGLWVESAYDYFSGVDSNGFWLDPAEADGETGVDASGLYLLT